MNFSLSLLKNRLFSLLERFPVTLLLIVSLWLFTTIKIDTLAYYSYSYWIFLTYGILISLVSTLFFEDFSNKNLKYIACITLTAVWGIFCCMLPPTDSLTFVGGIQLGIFGLILILSVFFISFLKKNKDINFWYFTLDIVIQFILSLLFSAIIAGGLSLALVSVDYLFNISIKPIVYFRLLTTVSLLFTPLFFLSGIPGKEKKHSSVVVPDKVLKVLGLYIILPILIIYAAILYIYLIRIIINWELPDGWVSVLVSIFVLGGFTVITLLFPLNITGENKIITFISRYFGLIALPLLILMTIGILRRISDYGISINRCYVLLLNVWYYGICIYLFLSKAKHIKWLYISPVLLLLISSFGPWSVFNITKRYMINKVEKGFNSVGLLDNGKIDLSSYAYPDDLFDKMDKAERKELSEAIKYVDIYYDKKDLQRFFADNLVKEDVTISQILSKMKIENVTWDHSEYFSIGNSENIFFENIKPYTSLLYINNISNQLGNKKAIIENNKKLIIQTQGKATYSVYIKDAVIDEIKHNTGKVTVENESYKLIISNINGNYFAEKDSISIHSLKAYLLYK